MNAWGWCDHYLLVTFMAGRETMVMLLDHATQEQFFEKAFGSTQWPGIVSVTTLTEEVFEMLAPRAEAIGRLIEGE